MGADNLCYYIIISSNGTIGDGILSDIIRNYVETQGTTDEKEGFN